MALNVGPLSAENPPFPCDVACAAAHFAAQSISCCTPLIRAQCAGGGSFEVPQSISICPNSSLENGCERPKAAHRWRNPWGLGCTCDSLRGFVHGGSGVAVLWTSCPTPLCTPRSSISAAGYSWVLPVPANVDEILAHLKILAKSPILAPSEPFGLSRQVALFLLADPCVAVSW